MNFTRRICEDFSIALLPVDTYPYHTSFLGRIQLHLEDISRNWLWDAKLFRGCVGQEAGAVPVADTFSLRVARSGTKRPAPAAMPWLSETCRPCLGAKDMPKHLRRWLLKVFTYRCRHFPLLLYFFDKFHWVSAVFNIAQKWGFFNLSVHEKSFRADRFSL